MLIITTALREEMKVLVLNNLPIETGIGHYAKALFDSLNPESELINFPSKFDISHGSFSGDVIKPATRSKVINAVTRPVIHWKTIRYIDRFPGIVHYAGHSMYPLGDHGAKNRIGTMHDFIPMGTFEGYLTTFYYRRNIKAMLDIPNLIVFTEYMKKKLLQDYAYTGRIFVVPHGYVEVFDRTNSGKNLIPFNKETDANYILSVSSDHPRKNLKILPLVMSMLGKRYKLVRVGPPVPGSITFDRVPPLQLAGIYRSCDAMIFPSLDEGFGIPMIEAFAAGLPVACSDIPVFREIGGDAVEFFDPNKLDEAAEAIKKIMADRETYATKSRMRSRRYSPELFSEKMRNIYNSIG